MDATNHTTGTPLNPTILPVIAEHIGILKGRRGGRPRILGHRIKVKHIAEWRERLKMSPTQIVEAHPTLSLAQVHAALAYFYDHQDEIRREIAEEDEIHDQLRRERPSILEEAKARKANAPNDSV